MAIFPPPSAQREVRFDDFFRTKAQKNLESAIMTTTDATVCIYGTLTEKKKLLCYELLTFWKICCSMGAAIL